MSATLSPQLVGATNETDAIPPEVAMIMSALEVGSFGLRNRRSSRRHSHRATASLRFFSDSQGTPPWQLYTRDINPRGVGFITTHRLPLGYGGTIEIAAPDGRRVSVHCTLIRCRQAAPGWYEGSLYFNREQLDLNFT